MTWSDDVWRFACGNVFIHTWIVLLNLRHFGLGGSQPPQISRSLLQIDVLPPYWARLHLWGLVRIWEFHERKKRMWNTLTPLSQVVLQLDQVPQEPQDESRRGGAIEMLMKLQNSVSHCIDWGALYCESQQSSSPLSNGWLALYSLSVCCLFVSMVTSPFISIVWCFRP